MSARDDLANLLDPRRKTRRSGGSVLLSAESVTEIILAAGWRPPARTIETDEELEGLPDLAIILSARNSVFRADDRFIEGDICLTGMDGGDYGSEEVALPATVLWEPGDDDE